MHIGGSNQDAGRDALDNEVVVDPKLVSDFVPARGGSAPAITMIRFAIRMRGDVPSCRPSRPAAVDRLVPRNTREICS